MRGGYNGRGRGGFNPGTAMGAVGAGMAAGAMMTGGPRRPPPGYPPNGPNGALERITVPEELPVAMGPPLPIDASQQYIDDNERRFDVRSPSIYTQPEEGPYGARAQSPARERASPYGSRVQSPSGTVRRPSPPPAMPPLPVHQVSELPGAPVGDWNPRRSQSQDP
jgi:hypothetical protein